MNEQESYIFMFLLCCIVGILTIYVVRKNIMMVWPKLQSRVKQKDKLYKDPAISFGFKIRLKLMAYIVFVLFFLSQAILLLVPILFFCCFFL